MTQFLRSTYQFPLLELRRYQQKALILVTNDNALERMDFTLVVVKLGFVRPVELLIQLDDIRIRGVPLV